MSVLKTESRVAGETARKFPATSAGRRESSPASTMPVLSPETSLLSEATDQYQDVIATHARTSFNFASRFLPPDRRQSSLTLYAFFRRLDNLVDEPVDRLSSTQTQLIIDGWRRWFLDPVNNAAPEPLLALNLDATIRRHRIPLEPFLDFLAGLEHDLYSTEIVDDDDLQLYCHQVASTVGIAMTHVLGATSPDALQAAAKLGAAMQLTNILRDVGEDLAAGRIYLPLETLERFDLSRADLQTMAENTGPDDRFRSMMRSRIRLARIWYQEGLVGIWSLPADCRFPILVAARLYRRLLTNIEKSDFDTLQRNVRTSRLDKCREGLISFALAKLWTHDE